MTFTKSELTLSVINVLETFSANYYHYNVAKETITKLQCQTTINIFLLNLWDS